MIQLFGCPLSMGANDDGLKISLKYLQENYGLKLKVLDEIITDEKDLPNLKHLNSIVKTCDAIAQYSYHEILQKNDFPLFIGGDHAAAMGTVSAAAVHYGEIGLIWVDAHTDINTDQTTVTGNIHGMPVAALLGMGEKSLIGFLNDKPKIKASNVVYIGLRDVDPPEAEFLKEFNIKHFTYQDVKDKGLDFCLKECVDYLSHLKHVHVSFDIDSVNPKLLPGVSVPVKDGFTIEEAYQVLSEFINRLPVSSMDIVEYNTVHDKEDITAKFTIQLIEDMKKLLEKKCG